MSTHTSNWRYPRRVACLLVFASQAALAAFAAPGAPASSRTATVIVTRPENQGFVNVCRATVTFASGRRLFLFGGDTKTIRLRAGSYNVSVTSPYPRGGGKSPWRSVPVSFRLEAGTRTRIEIEPETQGSEYTGVWLIRKLDDL